jgi:hypothetical protein
MSKPLDHPLETTLNIDTGSTFIPDLPEEAGDGYLAVAAASLPAPGPYVNDEEDLDITSKIEEVYDEAISAFQTQTNLVEIVDPRYAARNAEVAANYLKIALDAAATKARVKEGKRKSAQFIPYSNNTTNNNMVVADRNELLRLMAGKPEDK